MEHAVRWNIKVAKEIDLTLRTYLGAQGMNFNRTVQEIKSRNADADPEELQAIVDGAVREARAERRTKRKATRA